MDFSSDARVFVVFPTANPQRSRETLARWRERGYSSIVLLNHGFSTYGHDDVVTGADETIIDVPYKGYYRSQNYLARRACALGAVAVVCAGDDMDPDPVASPLHVARECYDKFCGSMFAMQPCGDPQGKDAAGLVAAERICGSPWVGPDYVRRGYQGRGAYCEDYVHFYGDEEAKVVAEMLGVLWMRYDLSQFHRHHSWGHTIKEPYQGATQGFWKPDQQMFNVRKAMGWPGHVPLEEVPHE